MSTKGSPFLYLACQAGRIAPLTPVSYATAKKSKAFCGGPFSLHLLQPEKGQAKCRHCPPLEKFLRTTMLEDKRLSHSSNVEVCYRLQEKTWCMQRFPFSSEFGQKIRKFSLHTGASHYLHMNLVLFRCNRSQIWQRFLFRQWLDLRRLSLMSIHEMLAYCR